MFPIYLVNVKKFNCGKKLYPLEKKSRFQVFAKYILGRNGHKYSMYKQNLETKKEKLEI